MEVQSKRSTSNISPAISMDCGCHWDRFGGYYARRAKSNKFFTRYHEGFSPIPALSWSRWPRKGMQCPSSSSIPPMANPPQQNHGKRGD